jgi:hypothetical protein
MAAEKVSMSGTITTTSRGRSVLSRGEHGQQLVVQHFHFALHAVGDVEFDRAVAAGGGGAVLGQRQQFAHGGLHLLQQRGPRLR